MVSLPGVHQWADFTAFSTADSGIDSYATIMFHDSDYSRLYLNGVPLQKIDSTYTSITKGYGCIQVPLTADRYILTGDSGAVAVDVY